MKRTEALLFFGTALFVLWLLVTLMNPWIGFIISVAIFLALIGFVFFIFICYLGTKRG